MAVRRASGCSSPISPKSSPGPRVATGTGPFGPATATSARKAAPRARKATTTAAEKVGA